jgi:hypothetical protein
MHQHAGDPSVYPAHGCLFVSTRAILLSVARTIPVPESEPFVINPKDRTVSHRPSFTEKRRARLGLKVDRDGLIGLRDGVYSMRITPEISPWLSLASARLIRPWPAGITA